MRFPLERVAPAIPHRKTQSQYKTSHIASVNNIYLASLPSLRRLDNRQEMSSSRPPFQAQATVIWHSGMEHQLKNKNVNKPRREPSLSGRLNRFKLHDQ